MCKGNKGVFTAKAIINPIKIYDWCKLFILLLNKEKKSVLPNIFIINNIDINKNKDPSIVYINIYKLALILYLFPANPININKQGNVNSNII
jgi:hypothetical protein